MVRKRMSVTQQISMQTCETLFEKGDDNHTDSGTDIHAMEAWWEWKPTVKHYYNRRHHHHHHHHHFKSIPYLQLCFHPETMTVHATIVRQSQCHSNRSIHKSLDVVVPCSTRDNETLYYDSDDDDEDIDSQSQSSSDVSTSGWTTGTASSHDGSIGSIRTTSDIGLCPITTGIKSKKSIVDANLM
jgi:hypothetical protein